MALKLGMAVDYYMYGICSCSPNSIIHFAFLALLSLGFSLTSLVGLGSSLSTVFPLLLLP